MNSFQEAAWLPPSWWSGRFLKEKQKEGVMLLIDRREQLRGWRVTIQGPKTTVKGTVTDIRPCAHETARCAVRIGYQNAATGRFAYHVVVVGLTHHHLRAAGRKIRLDRKTEKGHVILTPTSNNHRGN